jgi:hypothetical protein
MTSAVTVLVCAPGHRAAKRFHTAGCDDYDAGGIFTVERLPTDGISTLSAHLTRLAHDPTRFVIRGEPTDFSDLSRPRRRTSTPPDPQFRDVPSQLLWLDIDGAADIPWHPSDLPAAADRVRTALGPAFAHAACHLQLSASARPDSPLRAHIAFWLDTPLDCPALRQWAKRSPIPVDPHIFTPVQPHYTANPLFIRGAHDPIHPYPRHTFVAGDPVVLLELPIEDLLLDAPERYRQLMQTLGDGPRLKGFHDIVLRGVAAYVRGGGLLFDSLKQDIRARVERAPKDNHTPEYLAKLTSDRTLDALISSARQKFTLASDEPYTQQELNAFGPEILQRLILCRNPTRYVFDPARTTWDPFSPADARTALRERCSRFPISWHHTDGKLKKLADLEHEHSTTLSADSLLDLNATQAILEPIPNGHRLRLPAGRPTSTPVPAFSLAVDAWIDTLSRSDIVRTYLRDFLRFDLPLYILVLTGPKGTGKSSFAQALAQGFWGRGWTDLADLLPSRHRPVPWTADLLQCPFAVAPEGLPRVHAAALRALVGDSRTTIREKYRADAHLLGHLRALVLANPGEAGLDLDDGDDPDAFAATAERLQHVETTSASVEAFDYHTFVHEGALVRHAAFLADSPPPERRPRFGAEPDPAFARRLALASESAQTLLQWLALALTSPGTCPRLPAALDAAKGGPLRFSAGDIHAGWHSYPQAPQRPTMRALRSAWRAIAPGDLLTRDGLEGTNIPTGRIGNP